jgi:hypothetical protein
MIYNVCHLKRKFILQRMKMGFLYPRSCIESEPYPWSLLAAFPICHEHVPAHFSKCFSFNIRFYTLSVMGVLDVVSLGRQTGITFNKSLFRCTSHFYWQHWKRYVLNALFQILFKAKITTVGYICPLPFAAGKNRTVSNVANKQPTFPLLLLSQKILSTQRKGLCAVEVLRCLTEKAKI